MLVEGDGNVNSAGDLPNIVDAKCKAPSATAAQRAKIGQGRPRPSDGVISGAKTEVPAGIARDLPGGVDANATVVVGIAVEPIEDSGRGPRPPHRQIAYHPSLPALRR